MLRVSSNNEMLTNLQIKATKEGASDAVRNWFKGNYGQMSLADYFAQQVGNFNNPQARERLINHFGYTEKALDEKLELFNESFWASHKRWQRQEEIHQKTMSKYTPIFKEAEEIAAKVDVSDIRDGFPCGSVHLYLGASMHDTGLGKALRFKNGKRSTDAYKYQLPVRFPSYGQCISFDERIASEVEQFLKSKGVEANTYSWID